MTFINFYSGRLFYGCYIFFTYPSQSEQPWPALWLTVSRLPRQRLRTEEDPRPPLRHLLAQLLHRYALAGPHVRAHRV